MDHRQTKRKRLMKRKVGLWTENRRFTLSWFLFIAAISIVLVEFASTFFFSVSKSHVWKRLVVEKRKKKTKDIPKKKKKELKKSFFKERGRG